jgi:AsmA protein
VQAQISRTITFFQNKRRWLVWSAGALAVLAFFLYVVTPFVASTRIVRERIAFELSVWSGYQVSIEADPAIRLFPLRAVLSGVQLKEWTSDGPPVLAADEIILSLSPLDALLGDVSFSKMRIIRPVLRTEPTATGFHLPRLPGGGRMANAVKDAQVLTAASPDDPDVSMLPGDPFGTVEFFEGRILDAADDSELVTECSGILSWPRLDRPGSVRASGIWRGETVIIELASNEPMLLLAGGTAQMRVGFSGAPGNFDFDGTANLSDKPYFDGRGAFSTSSLRRMLEWSRADLGAQPDMNAVSMQGRVQGDGQRVKFDELALDVDGSSGTGVFELALSQPVPVVSGTLAFQTIDLMTIMSAFIPVGAEADEPGAILDTGFTERLNLDLRLSAAQATAGSVSLADVAATAQIRDGFALFDISDARAFDGSVQAGARLDRKGNSTDVELSLRATDVDGAAFGTAAGLAGVVPRGRGGFSLLLKGPIDRWDTIANRLQGSLTASFTSGTIPDMNLQEFLTRLGSSDVFSLRSVANGTLAVDRVDLKAAVANNIAQLEQADIVSGPHLVRLSGVVSFAGRGLALRGTVSPSKTPEDAAVQPTGGFFVGGTWMEPFITPIPSPPRLD